MTCSQCTDPATRMVTQDVVIGSIPLCDDPDCYTLLLAQLYEYADEFDKMETP